MIRLEEHTGPREALRPLFELAEDSATELDSYVELGRVLVARDGQEVLGHLHLVEAARPRQVEIKNMAVLETLRGQGVGSRLIAAAVELVASDGGESLLVATAAADVGNLRFYQRNGFRVLAVERDAFTAATGYPPGIVIDGIELRDRIWFDRTV